MIRNAALMRKLVFVFTLIAQSPIFCAGRTEPELPAAADRAALPAPDADGFVALFNGHDLAGWTGLADYWSVKDGSISGHETMEMSRQTFLILSALKVTDFELHFRYRFASPDGNSAVQFRSVILDPKAYVVGGYQADLDAKALFDGSIYDEAGKAGNRGTKSSRGEKTNWDARNTRYVEPLALNGAELGALIMPGSWNDAVLKV